MVGRISVLSQSTHTHTHNVSEVTRGLANDVSLWIECLRTMWLDGWHRRRYLFTGDEHERHRFLTVKNMIDLTL